MHHRMKSENSRLCSTYCMTNDPARTPLRPLKSAKYMIAVTDIPHHAAPKRLNGRRYRNENSSRDRYMTTAPQANAMTTERTIPATMAMARAELMYCPRSAAVAAGSAAICTVEAAMAAPSRQKTRATVVEVGRPSVLYMSSRMMFASMTER